MGGPKPKTVDEYISRLPSAAKAKAREIRQLIMETAPQAEEVMSYGMPYYRYKGRLAYWGAYENYIGFYVMSGARQALKDELEIFPGTTATLHFQFDKPLPKALIKKVIKAQLAANKLKDN